MIKTEDMILMNDNNGRAFTSDFLGRLANDNRNSRENICFFNSLKVKRVGKLQCNSHKI